jgi:hypothetical protein
MKYIISNRQHLKLFNIITSYIEDMIDFDQVYLDKNTGEEGLWILSTHDYDYVFFIYFEEYWHPYNPEGQKKISESPILVLENDYFQHLTNMFGNMWHEPMKNFVKNNFNVEIKTISLED